MKTERVYQTYKEAFAGIPKPFAFVDLDLFDENDRAIRRRADGKPVRIASKSVRCVTLLQRLLSAGDQYVGVIAYRAREAAFLAEKGIKDILVAYPEVDPVHIRAAAKAIQRGAVIRLMADRTEQVDRLTRVARETGVILPVCIDIDMSTSFPGLHFGVYRSGIRKPEQAVALARYIQQKPGIELAGLMGYEAQIAGLGDRAPGAGLMNLAVRALQSISRRRVCRFRQAVVEAIGPEHLPLVNAGGTGSLESSAREPWVTEVTAGSGFYAPALFDHYRHFQHHPAAGFALEITRLPQPGVYTCFGGGYIASGAVGRTKQPLPYLPAGCRLTGNEGAGEVQTPVLYQGPEQLGLGHPVFFRHAKAGELCEHFNYLYLLQNGEVVDRVATYRGEKMDNEQ